MAERMARPKNFTAQYSFMDRPEQVGRVRAWAEVRQMDLAALCREIMAAGLATLEPQWTAERNGTPLDPDFLAEHVRTAIK